LALVHFAPVGIHEPSPPPEPLEDRRALYTGRLRGQHSSIGREWPLSEIVDEAVVLRIAVDVDDELTEVGIRRHLHPVERMLKETADTRVHSVERLGVGGEETGEVLAEPRELAAVVICPGANQEVEVIPHQSSRRRSQRWVRYNGWRVGGSSDSCVSRGRDSRRSFRGCRCDSIGLVLAAEGWARSASSRLDRSEISGETLKVHLKPSAWRSSARLRSPSVSGYSRKPSGRHKIMIAQNRHYDKCRRDAADPLTAYPTSPPCVIMPETQPAQQTGR